MRRLQRTIMRAGQEMDVRPLYVGGLSGTAGTLEPGSNSSGEQKAWAATADGDSQRAGVPTESLAASGSVGNGEATADAGRVLTFGTYFNSFPASYWRRWSVVTDVVLSTTLSGSGRLVVYRSTSKGHIQRVASRTVETVEPVDFTIPLSLKPFIDGGSYWFNLEAADGPLTLHAADWMADVPHRPSGRISIGITTFNREDFCVNQLLTLSNSPDVLDIVDEILVIDQGTRSIRTHPEFVKAAEGLGEKLVLIEQGNIGGSGGFSRAMYETVNRGQSDYCLLLDDDAECEPEGILRAVTFADFARSPIIVGGQMFSLYDRSVLHAQGETVAPYTWFWGAAPHTEHGHDFAKHSFQTTPWLHRRTDADFNGWWMCLVPTRVTREIGLPLPMFLKWDDAEMGLRAKKSGYHTVTLPGAAVWHVPWHEKDDTIDWQAYLHKRNRIIAALIHSPYPRGGRLVRHSLETQIRHLISMQYSAAFLGLLAIEDILDGPDRMHHDLIHRVPEAMEIRKKFADSQMETSLDDFPPVRRHRPPRRGRTPRPPRNRPGLLAKLAIGALRQVAPVRVRARENPEDVVPHVDLQWWRLAAVDSALVSTADGTAASWYKRDPEKVKELIRRSIELHARLYLEWPKLSESYKEALPSLVSPVTWEKTFAESSAPLQGA